MGTFRYLDDSTFHCKAASLADLFETAASAAISIEYDPSTVGFERELGLSAIGKDLEELLGAWIDQCLRLRTESGFVPGDFIVYEVGEPPNARVGQTHMEVKGAVRGKGDGDWLVRADRRPESVVDGSVAIIHKRWSKQASVRLKI